MEEDRIKFTQFKNNFINPQDSLSMQKYPPQDNSHHCSYIVSKRKRKKSCMNWIKLLEVKNKNDENFFHEIRKALLTKVKKHFVFKTILKFYFYTHKS